MAKVSVYITSYNQIRFLAEAIESVLAQTLKPYEIIIVDDCSNDGSQDLISNYKTLYPNLVKPIFHENNLGVARTRTDALKYVHGDLVTYVDGDDKFLPAKLENEVNLLQNHSEADIAYSNFYFIQTDGTRVGTWAENGGLPQGYIFEHVFTKNFPKDSVFRNELISYRCLDERDFYDSTLVTHEDWDFKIRLTKKYRVVNSLIPLSERRLNPYGLSRMPAGQRLESMKRVVKKNQNLLSDISETNRVNIENLLAIKFSHLAFKAAIDEFRNGNPNLVLGYWNEACSYAFRYLKSKINRI